MLARMDNLPTIPDPGEAVTASLAFRIENDAIALVPHCADIPALDECLRRTSAFERYVKSREMQGLIRGAARRLEARIGQLLGRVTQGARTDLTFGHDRKLVSKDEREDFRILAYALDGECPLVADEWRKSRRSLVNLIRERLRMEIEEEPVALEEDFLSPAAADQAIKTTAKYLKDHTFRPFSGNTSMPQRSDGARVAGRYRGNCDRGTLTPIAFHETGIAFRANTPPTLTMSGQ
jgi:hypothetical protein